MSTDSVSSQLFLLSEVLDLGHKAREQAVLRQVERAVLAGEAAFAKAPTPDRQWAEMMALYRFAQNDQIPASKLREARGELTLRALDKSRPVLVVHDVTLLDYSSHNSKADRRPIGDHRGRGYEYVNIAAFDAEQGHFCGVLHDTVVDESGPDDRDVVDYDYDPLFQGFDEAEKKRLRENHRHQMAAHVRYLAPKLAPCCAIHVGDREFDDLFVLYEAASANSHILVRSMAPRNVQMHEAPWLPESAYTTPQTGHRAEKGMVCVNMGKAIPSLPLVPYKTIKLDKNGRVSPSQAAGGREAHLEIGACPLRLYRAAKRNKDKYYKTPKPVDLNMVVIREPEPPAGAKPLQWVLFTTLPAETLEEQKAVGSYYEKRWKIEEHHRLLKSGYKIEKSRLSDSSKIARLLVITTIASAIVLGLRQALNIPAKGKLDSASYEKLKEASRDLNNSEIPPGLRLYALAASLGGWLGRRGDPIGPETIMRGMARIGQTLAILEDAGDLLTELKKQGLLSILLQDGVKCV